MVQPEIRYCFFGEMGVGGDCYKDDILVTRDGVRTWTRDEEHCVAPEDIGSVLAERPEVVVFGTGFSGRMVVPEELQSFMRQRGIDTVAMPTGQAWDYYNRNLGRRKVAACMHLFC